MVNDLVDNDADVNSIDFNERNPLHKAYMKNNTDIADFLIENGSLTITTDIIPSFSFYFLNSNFGKKPISYLNSIQEY